MIDFDANPRDGGAQGACNTCCCETAKGQPGEVNKWRINYAPWSLPIGGKGITAKTQFHIELKTPCEQPLDPNSISADVVLLENVYGTPTALDLSTGIINPGNVPLEFSALAFFGPVQGIVTINADGTGTYQSRSAVPTYDRFFFSVTTPDKQMIVVEAIIAVSTTARTQPPATAEMATPRVLVPRDRVSVNSAMQTLEFPVQISPQAEYGDVYRITVRQQAQDCDCNCFTHESCYDLIIGKC